VAKVQEEQSRSVYVDPANIAANFAIAGDKDSTFAWLEKAASEKSAFLAYLKVDPSFDGVRSDPRFTALLKRMGLPR